MWESQDYHIRLQFNGKQRWFNTQTADLERAASVAMRFYEHLLVLGNWESARQKIFPKSSPSKGELTVGSYVEEVLRKSAKNERTLQIYASKLRTLVSALFNIPHSPRTQTTCRKSHSQWLEAVNRVKLSAITAEGIQVWKKNRIQLFGTTPLNEQKVRRTIHTILQNVKALFAPGLRRLVADEFPPNFFADNLLQEGIRITPYVSKIHNLGEFKDRVLEGLWASEAPVEREAGKAILLALFLGMRRGEMDTLNWKQIDFSTRQVAVCTTEFMRVKTHGSERTLVMPSWLCEFLQADRECHPRDTFVIHNSILPNPGLKTSQHYRCFRIFCHACKWLRDNGIDDPNPLHALRKEYGSEMNRCYGIYAAQRSLGHANIQMTCSTYVAQKQRYVIGEAE
ncbi:MAG: tyrosine-type recombinase/integrase [Puniceicoccales bacterium]|nr:tyrosine-type recombinase/integrase [Puniceicoccales bacterium]